MEARMATLENTITGLIARPKETGTDDTPEPPTPEIQSTNKVGVAEPANGASRPSAVNKKLSSFKEPIYSTPPYSTVEAQQMIEQELRQGERLSKQKREAFHAALGSLSDSLATSHHDQTTVLFDSYNLHLEAQKMNVAKYPEIETIKWMLTRTYLIFSTEFQKTNY